MDKTLNVLSQHERFCNACKFFFSVFLISILLSSGMYVCNMYAQWAYIQKKVQFSEVIITVCLAKGSCTNHVDSKGERGLKISEKCPRYRCRGGSKKSQKLSTWFVHAPVMKKKFNGAAQMRSAK